MSQIPELPPSALQGIGATPGARPAREGASARPTGPAFEVLLERLSARAAELEEKSRTLSEPAELPDALDAARSSLADALTLGEELLEAFRAAQQATEARP